MAPNAPSGQGPMTGKKAPGFSLSDQQGRTHALGSYKDKWVVLYFYPKDDTPGCTKESCGFRDLTAEFAKAGAVVLGCSILDGASKKKFAEKHALNFPLLADEDNKVAEAYGVWQEKSMYGKKFMGINRETFVIAPDGTIAAHWPKAKGNEEHPAEVLAWLKENAK